MTTQKITNMKKSTKKKIGVRKEKMDWQRIITLGAAGKYIQDRLNEELDKIPKK